MSNNSKNGAFRKKKVYFTQVSNNALRDRSLSLKAKGLYALIQSYITIEDFTLYKSYLKQQCQEGEKAFENAWKELKAKGYLIQYRLQDNETKQFYYEYELLDQQNIELAEEIHSKQNRKKQEEKSHNPKKEGMDKKDEKSKKAIPTILEGMGNGYDGQGGIYTNTDLNNIIKTNTDISISTSTDDLKQLFESNICTLGKTTEVQFNSYLNKYNYNFIKAVIMYCIRCKASSFSYFKKTIEKYIQENITTAPDFLNAVEKYVTDKYKNNTTVATKNKDNKYNTTKKGTFNNFEQRSYNFEELEKDLIGWYNNGDDLAE